MKPKLLTVALFVVMYLSERFFKAWSLVFFLVFFLVCGIIAANEGKYVFVIPCILACWEIRGLAAWYAEND